MRAPFIIFIALCAAGLGGCGKFPELEVSEAQFDSKTPYPKLVPLEELLKEPEATITDEVQTDLTTRRDDLQATPEAQGVSDTSDPVLDRIDELRARRDAQAASDPAIDDELRKRMEAGITAPTVPE
ncbi:MAG: hypothetical protein WBC85_04630 [Planktotalea sp.]|uniref:hypothetical protein n=1 Tax=Planktotalea sp. TaxID=2029877 RepID=UPI003C794E16